MADRRKEARPDPIAYEVTLDTVDKEKLPRVSAKSKTKSEKATKAAASNDDEDDADDKEDEGPIPDPIKSEALNILNDLANQIQGTRTAKIMDRE